MTNETRSPNVEGRLGVQLPDSSFGFRHFRQLRRLAAHYLKRERVGHTLSLDETAEARHVSRDTVERDWKMAKLWLLRELRGLALDDT